MKFCFTIILFLMLSVLAVSTEAQVSSSQDSLKVDGQAFKFEAVSYTHLTLPTICSV